MSTAADHGAGHKVAGTGFEGRASIIRTHCKDGAKLRLEREPDNPHDPKAVGVWMEVPGFFGKKWKKIGFVKASRNKKLAHTLDAGEKVTARVRSFYAPPHMEHPRVSIEIFY